MKCRSFIYYIFILLYIGNSAYSIGDENIMSVTDTAKKPIEIITRQLKSRLDISGKRMLIDELYSTYSIDEIVSGGKALQNELLVAITPKYLLNTNVRTATQVLVLLSYFGEDQCIIDALKHERNKYRKYWIRGAEGGPIELSFYFDVALFLIGDKNSEFRIYIEYKYGNLDNASYLISALKDYRAHDKIIAHNILYNLLQDDRYMIVLGGARRIKICYYAAWLILDPNSINEGVTISYSDTERLKAMASLVNSQR